MRLKTLPLILAYLFLTLILITPFTHRVVAGNITTTITPDPATINENTLGVNVTWSGLQDGQTYKLCYSSDCSASVNLPPINGNISLDLCGSGDGLKSCDSTPNDDWFHGGATYSMKLLDTNGTPHVAEFRIAHYYPEASLDQSDDDKVILTLNGCRHPCSNSDRNDYDLDLVNTPSPADPNDLQVLPSGSGSQEITIMGNPIAQDPGDYTLLIKDVEEGENFAYFKITFTIDTEGKLQNVVIKEDPTHNDIGLGAGKNPCTKLSCETAFGNLATNLSDFTQNALKIATGIAGGLALILMVFGSIRVLTSSGDQQRLNGGREMITAAVVGLLFIIFSVVILRFLGVNIIGL